MAKWDNHYLLEDMKKRGIGPLFGKGDTGRESALAFRKFAAENGETCHVLRDERKNYFIHTDESFKSLNELRRSKGMQEREPITE